MRIVLKTGDFAIEKNEIIHNEALKTGLPHLSRDSTLNKGFAIRETEGESRLLVYFESRADWNDVIEECSNFINEQRSFLLFLKEHTYTYFDIGVDYSEINNDIYFEFIFPSRLINILSESDLSYCITLYREFA